MADTPSSPVCRLDWLDGQPVSREFGDIYFSRDSGIEETRHVFLHSNRLAERWAALASGEFFVIGETGFGTGLNFLCAWQEWDRHAPPSARLHFVSCEKFPLQRSELARTLALWPELAPCAGLLLEQYRALTPGWNRLTFLQGRIRLTLLIGDVLDTLPLCAMKVDAWFLDGFAPAKNPDMWQPELYRTMARLSHPGATFATYTCAGEVRRGLAEAGFGVERVRGFGSKREMLRGQLSSAVTPAWQAPWFARPAAPSASAIVLGGGIAGAATAAALAGRGCQVTLIERHAKLAQEGSGNPQGILYAKLAPDTPPLSRLTLAGYGHTLRLLPQLLGEEGENWHACGVLQLAQHGETAARQAKVAAAYGPGLMEQLDLQAASQRAGVTLPCGGLFFPEAGWLHPPALVNALAATPGIRIASGRPVAEVRREGRDWLVLDEAGEIARAPLLIVATADTSLNFAPLSYLPLRCSRGQITKVPSTPASRSLSTVLCGEGYIAPPRGGEHTLGATYAPCDGNFSVTAGDHAANLAGLEQMAPALHAALDGTRLDPAALDGRTSRRAVTPDHLPLLGPIVDTAAFSKAYRALSRDAKLKLDEPAPVLPGLYVNAGHGSRGLLTAPLAGEALVAMIFGEPSPLPAGLLDCIHPSRFLVRELVRRKPAEDQSPS